MNKSILHTISFLCFASVSINQPETIAQTIKYTYDAAGNRIRREAIIPNSDPTTGEDPLPIANISNFFTQFFNDKYKY